MKTLTKLLAISIIFLSACTTSYQAGGYDDVYFSKGNNPVVSSTNQAPTAVAPASAEPVNSQPVATPDNKSYTGDGENVGEYYGSDQPAYTDNQTYTDENGNNYVTNNYYYGNDFVYDDYYDYAYSSRIRRFHNSYYNYGYYDDYYTNYYWYDYNPWNFGTSIYFGYSWWPSYYYGWGGNYNCWNNYSWYPYHGYPSYYNYPYYGYWGGYGWGYNNGYWDGYTNGYWDGYNDGYWAGNYGGNYYYNSYDDNSYYYGPRNDIGTSSNIGGNSRDWSFAEKYETANASQLGLTPEPTIQNTTVTPLVSGSNGVGSKENGNGISGLGTATQSNGDSDQ